MKTLIALVVVCLLAAGCGGARSAGNSTTTKSSAPAFSNGATLATATSYWSAPVCAITLLTGQTVTRPIDFALTNDGGFESTFSGSTCKGTYVMQPQGSNVALVVTTSSDPVATCPAGLLP
jgi:hypothetical protein